MTRQDFIFHTERLREGVARLIKDDTDNLAENGDLDGATMIELERIAKTRKMFKELAKRLYEDGAVAQRVMTDKLRAGEADQAQLSLFEGRE